MDSLRLLTWNVNGVRARAGELTALLERERPDVWCLQELKATPEQVPPELTSQPDYRVYWHGAGPYSGVALGLRGASFPGVEFAHPPFDCEQRMVTAAVGRLVFASVYVPNGGKDYAAKLAFLDALARWVEEIRAAGQTLVLAGDLNVAREERDVHPKERKPGAIGQRAEERERLEQLLAGGGLVDVGRALDPDNDGLYTWWAPWRSLRQRNIGWRIDYVLASAGREVVPTQSTVQRETGTSDHAPLVVELALVEAGAGARSGQSPS
jgi:exodeoxyribonuclease-3